MLTEVYHREIAQNLTVDLQNVFEDWERRGDLVSQLGLAGQERYMDALEKAKDIPFKLLSPEELEIWRAYLPGLYLEDSRIVERRDRPFPPAERIVTFNEGLIPLPILEAWLECRRLNYFDSYAIRTGRNPDPILLGIKGPLRFLIARWGESLKPFEEIEREVKEGTANRRRSLA